MLRHTFAAAGCAVLMSMSAFAADTMPHALARQVADRTIQLVESKAVYPRQQGEYAQARSELLALLDGQDGDVEREALYARVRALLRTLDADGHSILIPPSRPLQAWRAPEAGPPPLFTLVSTGRGKVLRWTPPAIVGDGTRYPGYLNTFYDAAAAHPELAQACALVVDLSEQTGGNAWPPMIAMAPLFGDANMARWVDRAGQRSAFVVPASLTAMNRQYGGGGRANPLTPFASGPLAVVVGDHTSSAGEMLLVALMGEERVQTFGRRSQGLSTANGTYKLADGSLLLLTELRYALGDGPVYRGGIAPMHPAAAGEAMDASVRTAAEWAAANSPRCKAAQPAVANAE